MAHSKFTKEEQLKKVAELSAEPMKLSAREIGAILGISDRQVRNLRAQIREGIHGLTYTPPPKDNQTLEPHLRKLTKRTADGFQLFYERYSGLKLPPHCYLWVEDYLKHDRLLLNVPPRHAKSKIFSVWIPLWEIAMNRDIQILVITATEKMAEKWAREVAWHLEFNKKLISDFGQFKPEERSTPWRHLQGELMVAGRKRDILMGDLTFQIKGYGQQIIGMESDLIIADDLVDPAKMRVGEKYKEDVSEKFHGELMTRLSPDGRAVVVGQRVHFQDLYGELEAKTLTRVEGNPPLWHNIKYPAILDWEKKEVLWPEVWPFDRLMVTYEDIKRKDSTALFETMYQQNPLPPEASIFRPEWFDGDALNPGCWDFNRPAGTGIEVPEDHKKVRVVSIDPSPSRATGLIVADVVSPYKREPHVPFLPVYGIIEIQRGRWDLRETIAQLTRVAKQYSPDYVIFEVNAAQRWFLQDIEFLKLQKEMGITVIAHTTGTNKTNEEFGLQSLADDVRAGRVRLPGGDLLGRRMGELLKGECVTYPYGPYTDIMMAAWFIRFNAAKLAPRLHVTNRKQRIGSHFKVPPRVKEGWAWLKS